MYAVPFNSVILKNGTNLAQQSFHTREEVPYIAHNTSQYLVVHARMFGSLLDINSCRSAEVAFVIRF